MASQPDLIPGLYRREPYPVSAGFKVSGPSQEAAQTVDAETGRALVLACITEQPCTADEVAEALKLDRLYVRPRCSELVTLGKIQATAERRRNASGKHATVWQVVR